MVPTPRTIAAFKGDWLIGSSREIDRCLLRTKRAVYFFLLDIISTINVPNEIMSVNV